MTAPLTHLLSAAYVAFVVEADSTFELRAAHHTAESGPRPGSKVTPWLISMAMWTNCLKHLADGPLTVREVERRARMTTNLDGMRRWGWVTIQQPTGASAKPIRRTAVLTQTTAGAAANGIWPGVVAEIEQRWRGRFGAGPMDELRARLEAIAGRLPGDLPESLPILRCAFYHQPTAEPERPREERPVPSHLPLLGLLTRPLLTIALAFETGSRLSLAMAEDVVAALGETWADVRGLPEATGVSKEALAMALGWLHGRGLCELRSAERTRQARLTQEGLAARVLAGRRLAEVEAEWRRAAGADDVDAIRRLLAPLATSDGRAPSPLLAGARAPPGTWRSRRPAPVSFPRFPTVLHRGGYPDGA